MCEYCYIAYDITHSELNICVLENRHSDLRKSSGL